LKNIQSSPDRVKRRRDHFMAVAGHSEIIDWGASGAAH
jgi:hypothetical protein